MGKIGEIASYVVVVAAIVGAYAFGGRSTYHVVHSTPSGERYELQCWKRTSESSTESYHVNRYWVDEKGVKAQYRCERDNADSHAWAVASAVVWPVALPIVGSFKAADALAGWF
jgi:hypothetical protein